MLIIQVEIQTLPQTLEDLLEQEHLVQLVHMLLVQVVELVTLMVELVGLELLVQQEIHMVIQ
jgi:hypothetical protein